MSEVARIPQAAGPYIKGVVSGCVTPPQSSDTVSKTVSVGKTRKWEEGKGVNEKEKEGRKEERKRKKKEKEEENEEGERRKREIKKKNTVKKRIEN